MIEQVKWNRCLSGGNF